MTTTAETKTTEETKKPAPKKAAQGADGAKKASAKADAPEQAGIQYKFADKSAAEAPKIALTNIVMPDFDSRANESEPDDVFIADVKERGIITPISVAPLEDGKYLLVAGRRRFKAAKAAGLKEIPVAPLVFTDDAGTEGLTAKDKAELVCLSENVHREGLNSWDLAVQMRHFRDVKGWSQTRIAKVLGRKDAYVSQYLGFFELDKRVQTIIRTNAADGGVISKARLLKQIKDPEQQLQVAKECFDKTSPWNVTQLNEVVEGIKLKEEEKARKEAERAAAKEKGEKKPRKAAASTEGEGEGEGDEPEASEFASASIELKIAEVRKLADLVAARHAKKREEFASANAKDKHAIEVKLAYEKGSLDTIKMLLGQKAAPKSIVSE